MYVIFKCGYPFNDIGSIPVINPKIQGNLLDIIDAGNFIGVSELRLQVRITGPDVKIVSDVEKWIEMPKPGPENTPGIS